MKTLVAGLIVGLMIVLGTIACSNANNAAIAGWGHKQHVELLSSYDGHIIAEWHTTGKIEQEQQSDGIYFSDDRSGKLVQVYGGPVVVEVE